MHSSDQRVDGLDFLLSCCVQPGEFHKKGWEWYVLDSERLNQDLIQIMFRESLAFGQTLLNVSWPEIKCIRQPERGLFDLLCSCGDDAIYIEIKVDERWGQCDRQCQFLSDRNARGLFLFLSQVGTDYSRDDVARITQDRGKKASYTDLYRALDAVQGDNVSAGYLAIAAAYRRALQAQERRTVEAYRLDPNR